jgi:DNA-binding GntR family transcriptional regulator
MSPTPIIQALKFLEFQDLVRHEHNRGYYAQPISLQEVEEVYELREIIEVSLLSKTIEKMNKKATKRLDRALNAYLDSAQKLYADFGTSGVLFNDELLKDMEFHLTLADLSESHSHIKILRNLFDLLYLKYRGSILFATLMGGIDIQHRAIFDAVVRKDLKAAEEALRGHISGVKKHVLEGLRKKLREKNGLIF